MSKLSRRSNEASNSNRSTIKFCTGTSKLMSYVCMLWLVGVGICCWDLGWGWDV